MNKRMIKVLFHLISWLKLDQTVRTSIIGKSNKNLEDYKGRVKK